MNVTSHLIFPLVILKPFQKISPNGLSSENYLFRCKQSNVSVNAVTSINKTAGEAHKLIEFH